MIRKNGDKRNVLHICNFAAPYRGNFIDSLEALEVYDERIMNYYLFPSSAKLKKETMEWINALNKEKVVAYIQEENIIANAILLKKIIVKHKIWRIIRHFSDNRIDFLVRIMFDGRKVVRFFHSRFIVSNSVIKKKLRRILWKNNTLVGVSESVSNQIKNVLPDYTITTILNAINFERLNCTIPRMNKKTLNLMIMGGDFETKGVDIAIKACEKIRNKYDIVLRIVGEGNKKKNEVLIREILRKTVEWIEILPNTNKIGDYYKTNDIFLSPSRHEAFGYANIEAAYCENSIVLSRVGGQKELEINGAYWVEPENVEDLAEKIELAIKELNTQDKNKTKSRTKLEVINRYSLKEWAEKVRDVLFDIEY